LLDGLERPLEVAVCDVDHERVDAGRDQAVAASDVILVDSDGGGHPFVSGRHPLDLCGLVVRFEKSVEDTHSAGPREFDRQFGFRDGVHGGGDQRRLEFDARRKRCREIHVVAAVDWRAPRDEEHVTVAQSDAKVVHNPSILRAPVG